MKYLTLDSGVINMDKNIKYFIVFAVSQNCNSFGLKEFFAVTKDGLAFKAYANDLNIPKKHDVLSLEVTGKAKINFGNYECPELLPKPSKEIIKGAWKG